MKKCMLSNVFVYMLILLTACGQESQNLDEITHNSSAEHTEKKTCAICETTYDEGGYLLSLGGEDRNVCKTCRDGLLLSNKAVIINGKEETPFKNTEVYRDSLIAMEIADGWHISSADAESGIVKCLLENDSNSDSRILFGWYDCFEEVDDINTEERQAMSFCDGGISEDELISLTAPEDAESYTVETIQGQNWLFYTKDNKELEIYTIRDGILYVLGTTGPSDEDSRIMRRLSAVTETACIAYPEIETIHSTLDQ